jgi:hypothetical protein
MIEHLLSLILSPLLDLDQRFETEEFLDFMTAVFALALFALSISAYRKTHLSSLLIVSAAFGLFAVEVGIRQIDAFVLAVGLQTEQVITSMMMFVILLLFFIAVVVKK